MLEITEIEISNNPVMTNERFQIRVRSVYKELHADHETGTADNK